MSESLAAQGHWQKSSFCATSACLEIALLNGLIRVRNSNDPAVSVAFTLAEWSAFAAAMRAGEFADLDGSSIA